MDNLFLQTYLHDHIPLTKAMQITVIEATASGVKLAAPLAPNINHRDTVFGGSASAVAIMSAWALIYVQLSEQDIASRLVIQRNTMDYSQPILSDFTAVSAIENQNAWIRFLDILKRRQRARITVTSTLFCAGNEVGRFEGDFVAIGLKPFKSA